MKQLVGYIRKSRVLSTHGVSWEVQEAAVRSLAGDRELLLLSDWNRSGRGTGRRPGFAQMVAMVEADEVEAVLAYSLSRFARSVKDFTTFAELCVAHGTAIRFAVESNLNIEVNGQSATRSLLLNVMMSFAQFEADIAAERSKEGVAVRRGRGDAIGPSFYGGKPGEDPAAVVAAYRSTLSIIGAVREMNRTHVPTRSGKPWTTTSARAVLVHAGAIPRRGRPGAKAQAPYRFYGLLRCGRCSRILTGIRQAPYASVYYRCLMGRADPNHGTPQQIPESTILEWAKAEAGRLVTPDIVIVEQERQAEHDRLEARKMRIEDMYELRDIDRDEYLRRMAVVKDAEDALEAQEASRAILAVPKVIDWDGWAPEDVNHVLTAMWSEVRLDELQQPVAARWNYPEWRAP